MSKCTRCNITLPTAVAQTLCDECEDAPEPKIRESVPTRRLRIVHGGRDDAGIYYPSYHPRRKAPR